MLSRRSQSSIATKHRSLRPNNFRNCHHVMSAVNDSWCHHYFSRPHVIGLHHLTKGVVSSNPKWVHHLPCQPCEPNRRRTHRRSFNCHQNCLHHSCLVQQPQVKFGTRDFQRKSSFLCSTFNSLCGFYPLFLIHVGTNFC